MSELYSSLKSFAFPEKLYSVTRGEITAPIHVRIKPINACNHRCWFCAYRADTLDLGSEMKLKDRIPSEKMREIVADLIEMKVQAVTFSGGGEPLIYPNIADTVAALGQAKIRIGTLTNGAFLKDEVAEAFATFGSWVRISMDAWDSESCRKNRGVKAEEYEKILENIRNFRKRESKCILGISFIVTEENASHLLEMAERFKDLGVNHVKFSPCIISNSSDENNRYHAPIISLVEAQLESALELNGQDFKIVNHYHQLESTFHKDYQHCPFLQMLTIIGADCKVYTCQDKAYTTSGCLGSIQSVRFKEFWFSDQNREKLLRLDPSRECRHHCVANEKNKMLLQFTNLNREHAAFV